MKNITKTNTISDQAVVINGSSTYTKERIESPAVNT